MTAPDAVRRQHSDVTAVLRRFARRCRDRQQRDLAQQMLDYLAQHSTGTTRACHPDHVTASAVVLAPDASEVMLDLHRKTNRWLQFGGHLEDTDLSLAAAALREAIEESGCPGVTLLSPDPVAVDVHPAPCGARRHLDVQLVAVAPRTARPVASAESHDVAWFRTDALPPDADESVRRLVAQAVDRLRDGAPSGAPIPSS
jgi:8-oxo-dGTP pyrophosphatase MutT (NUDIX family)